MTTRTEAVEAIMREFVAGWGTTYPYALDNEVYDSEDTPWARLTIIHNTSPQRTLGKTGNRLFERLGSVFVNIFLPPNKGRALADTLSDTVTDIFEGKKIQPEAVSFFEVVAREQGNPDKKDFQVVVQAFFGYDEVK